MTNFHDSFTRSYSGVAPHNGGEIFGRFIGGVIGRFLLGATYAAGVLTVADIWGVI